MASTTMSTGISTSSGTTNYTSTNSTGTVPCTGFPNLNYTGLNGTICAVSIPPATVNVSSCCAGGHVRTVNNCTQFCETNEQSFANCVNNLHQGFFLATQCQTVINGTVNGTNPTGPEPPTGNAINLRANFGVGTVGLILSLAFATLLL